LELREVPLSDLRAYNEPFIEQAARREPHPETRTRGPILLDSDLSVLEGFHRADNALRRGEQSIQAWVRREPVAESVTAVRNAALAEDRAALDLPELATAEPRRAPEVHQRAVEANAEDPRSVDRLVTRALEGGKNLTDVETAQVRLRAQEIKNRVNELKREIDAADDPAAIKEHRNEMEALTDEFDRLSQAVRKAGTEWGRAGIARQQPINQDFDLVSMRTRLKAAKGAPLSETEIADVEALHKKISDLEARLTEAESKSVKQEADRQVAKVRRRRSRAETKAALDAEAVVIRQNVAAELARLRSGGTQPSGLAGLDPEGRLTKELIRYVHNRAKANLQLPLESLIDEAHDLVRDLGASRRQVMEALVGYGKQQSQRSPEARRLTEINAEINRILREQDAAAGRRSPRQEGPRRDYQRNQTRLRQLEQQRVEYERRIAASDFGPRPARRPVVYNREVNAAREAVERARDEFQQREREYRRANRTPFEKGLDLLTRWKRFAVLTYPTTLGKLTTAAAGRMVQTPVEEAIGGVLSKIPGISRIASRAPREGGVNLKAEAKAVSQLWQSDSFKGMMDQLKSGRDMLDVLYGDKKGAERGFLELPGRAHGSLKEIPKRAEFFRAFEKRLAHAGRNGADIADPQVQLGTAMEAYNDARRSIFMQPNVVSDVFNELMRSLDRRGTGGKVLRTIGRIEFPITRVPVNYVAEQSSLIPPIGIAKGIIRIALSKGISNLKPEEADYVMRAWKKSGIGMGVMALGYLNPQTFGGYYQPHDKRGQDEAQFGEVKLGQVHIPKWATHIPLIEAAQFGATVRRVQDEMAAKGADHPAAAGVAHASWELAKEVPFINQPERILRAMESGDKLKAGKVLVGQEVRGMIPGFVQQVARSTDQTSYGDNRTRRSQGFTDEVKQGIPGLRQTVPISTMFGAKARPSSDEAQRLNMRLVGVHISPKETPQQFAARRAVVLPLLTNALDALVTSDSYKSKSDDDKRKAIHATVEQVTREHPPGAQLSGRPARPIRPARESRPSRADRQ
jgi:hypothetical protein